MVEAAGVELFRVLTARKLLILGTATTARKASLPNPLYVYCTKMLCTRNSDAQLIATAVSHRFAAMDREKTRPSFRRYQHRASPALGRFFKDIKERDLAIDLVVRASTLQN
jgi:hypothetical protein